MNSPEQVGLTGHKVYGHVGNVTVTDRAGGSIYIERADVSELVRAIEKAAKR